MGKYHYGVILDAGSSGTRLHVYSWLKEAQAKKGASAEQLKSLPELITKDKWTIKIKPGVSSFGETPNLVGPEHLQTLFQHALDIVPKDEIESTPVFLLATAGMRLLHKTQREELLRQICSYTTSATKFLLPDCDLHIQVIPGETEGLYGWIAANYLLGGFNNPDEHDHGKGHHTYGFLDMGGASAQIAFAPNGTEAEKHASDLKLLRLRRVNGDAAEYRVFVTTWLEFGVHEARNRYVTTLTDMHPSAEELPDPCLPNNLRLGIEGQLLIEEPQPGTPYLLGTGKFDECLRQTFPLLAKDAPCEDKPCLMNGVHVPAIDFDVNHFVGVSEYWHTTHEIFEMGYKDKAYDFNTYQDRVSKFCSQDWTAIQGAVAAHKYGKKVDEHTAEEVCFKASWLINVLHDGIGVPRVGIEETKGSGHNGTKEVLESGRQKGYLAPFQAVNKIDHTEVSWTLGKMVLYAASQMSPTSADSLPVGFGANQAGIPQDFQYPGGSKSTSISSNASEIFIPEPEPEPEPDSDSLSDQIKDSLFDADSPRRIPGFILFLFMVSIVLFFLLGRERRSRLYQKLPLVSASKRRNLGGPKIPFLFRTSPSYDRLMEGGQLPSADQFELDDIDSESSTSSPSSSMRRTHLSRGAFGASASASNVNLIAQNGGALFGGRKSRTGSPTRDKGSYKD
ncbi:MAG: hypothetical protein Q9227_005878 [Pyrenula ochraceoflavens]